MPRQYKVTLLTILLCLVAIEVPADSWDEGNYKPYNTDVVLEKTNLPLLFIDTRDKAGHTTVIHKDYRVAVRMKIISNADGVNYGDTVAHPNQTIDYEGWVGIKYRGSSSFYDSDKKPYGFRTLKTADVNGKKEKVKLLGLPEDNNWVLLAPYHDRSSSSRLSVSYARSSLTASTMVSISSARKQASARTA